MISRDAHAEGSGNVTDAAGVAEYYDRNTRRFLLAGGGRNSHSMHRELWGRGVSSAKEAADYINCVIADQVADSVTRPDPFVLDFGCGVGGTLFHLATRFPAARLHGVTVSRRQVEIADRLVRQLGHTDRCTFTLGDFDTVDLDARADAIVAVESFAHSRSAKAFLRSAWKHLLPGGALIVVDDFLGRDAGAMDPRQHRYVEQLRAGWRVPAICTLDRFIGAAQEVDLSVEKTLDLTPLTRPGSRVRDRLVAATSPVLARLGLHRFPFCGNIIGGHALQIGMREGFLRYELVALRKPA